MAYPHESKYKKEDRWGEKTTCGDPDFLDAKVGDRDKHICRSLTVDGPTLLNDTEVIPPAITVGGRTFVPTVLKYVSGVSVSMSRAGLFPGDGGDSGGGDGGGSATPTTNVTYSTLVVLAEVNSAG